MVCIHIPSGCAGGSIITVAVRCAIVVMGADMIRELHAGLRDLWHHGAFCGLDHPLGCCCAGSRLASVLFTSGHMAHGNR
jgi:hypothetical protein